MLLQGVNDLIKRVVGLLPSSKKLSGVLKGFVLRDILDGDDRSVALLEDLDHRLGVQVVIVSQLGSPRCTRASFTFGRCMEQVVRVIPATLLNLLDDLICVPDIPFGYGLSGLVRQHPHGVVIKLHMVSEPEAQFCGET